MVSSRLLLLLLLLLWRLLEALTVQSPSLEQVTALQADAPSEVPRQFEPAGLRRRPIKAHFSLALKKSKVSSTLLA